MKLLTKCRAPPSPSSLSLDVGFPPSSLLSPFSPTWPLSESNKTFHLQFRDKIMDVFCLLTFSFLFLQQNPQRHSIQDPHPAVFGAFPTQHGLSGRLMAGALHEHCWPLHLHGLLSALLLARLLHMDGSGDFTPLPEYCQGLPTTCVALHAEILSAGMG